MKKRVTEAQIVYALKRAEAGAPVAEVTRKMNINRSYEHSFSALSEIPGAGIW